MLRNGRILLAAATLAVAAIFATPSAASAAGSYFSITTPANGSVINSISSTPGLSYAAGYAFQSTPTCQWDVLPSGTCGGALSKPTNAGLHTLTVSGTIVTSPGGVVVGPDSDSVTVEYDPTPPTLTIDSPATNGVELAQKRPPISFTAADDPSDLHGTVTATCRIDDGAAVPCGTSPFTPGSDLSEGGHGIVISATDGANTVDATRTFIVDTVAPLINVIFPTPGVVVDSSVPEVNLSIDGATAGAFCKFDDQPYQACGASWLGGTLADGAHTLYVRGVDLAGNETVVVVPFSVDDALGPAPVPFETSITGGKGGKVRRGKFSVKTGFSLVGPDGADPSVVCGATVRATLKPKGGRSYRKLVKLRRRGEICRLSATFTLPKRFKGKRAKLTFRYPGTSVLGVIQRSKTIKKL